MWLLGLVLVLTLLRAIRSQRRVADREHREPGRLIRIGKRFVQALTYTVTPRGRGEYEMPPLRRLELGAYAALLACFVLALANTNPTLRDMVNALI